MEAIETGLDICKARAIVMCFPPSSRSYNDPISSKFLSRKDRFKLRIIRIPSILRTYTSNLEKIRPGMLGYYYNRFSHFDTVVKNSLLNDNITNIVNLGSGMDTKAYYMDGIQNIHYYEVDHPEVIALKKEKIKTIFGKLPDHVSYVPVDFNKQNVKTELIKAGFNLNDKSLFIWESVSPYLNEDENKAIFEFIAQSKPGSKMAFTYVKEELISGEGLTQKTLLNIHDTFVKKDNILIHGYNPNTIEELIANYNLNTIEHIGFNELKYESNNLDSFGIDVADVEQFILAEIK